MSWLTLVGCGSNVNLVYKAFVMLLQCCFADPTYMLPKCRILPDILGRKRPPPSYITVGLEVRVCPQTWLRMSAVLHGTVGWAQKTRVLI